MRDKPPIWREKRFIALTEQIQPKFTAAAPKDTLAQAVEAILDKPLQTDDDVQVSILFFFFAVNSLAR